MVPAGDVRPGRGLGPPARGRARAVRARRAGGRAQGPAAPVVLLRARQRRAGRAPGRPDRRARRRLPQRRGSGRGVPVRAVREVRGRRAGVPGGRRRRGRRPLAAAGADHVAQVAPGAGHGRAAAVRLRAQAAGVRGRGVQGHVGGETRRRNDRAGSVRDGHSSSGRALPATAVFALSCPTGGGGGGGSRTRRRREAGRPGNRAGRRVPGVGGRRTGAGGLGGGRQESRSRQTAAQHGPGRTGTGAAVAGRRVRGRRGGRHSGRRGTGAVRVGPPARGGGRRDDDGAVRGRPSVSGRVSAPRPPAPDAGPAAVGVPCRTARRVAPHVLAPGRMAAPAGPGRVAFAGRVRPGAVPGLGVARRWAAGRRTKRSVNRSSGRATRVRDQTYSAAPSEVVSRRYVHEENGVIPYYNIIGALGGETRKTFFERSFKI